MTLLDDPTTSARRRATSDRPPSTEMSAALLRDLLAQPWWRRRFPGPVERRFQHDTARIRARRLVACCVVSLASFGWFSTATVAAQPDLGWLLHPLRWSIVAVSVLTIVAGCVLLRRCPAPSTLGLQLGVAAFSVGISVFGITAAAYSAHAGIGSASLLVSMVFAGAVARHRFGLYAPLWAGTVLGYAVLGHPSTAGPSAVHTALAWLFAAALVLAVLANIRLDRGARRLWLLNQPVDLPRAEQQPVVPPAQLSPAGRNRQLLAQVGAAAGTTLYVAVCGSLVPDVSRTTVTGLLLLDVAVVVVAVLARRWAPGRLTSAMVSPAIALAAATTVLALISGSAAPGAPVLAFGLFLLPLWLAVAGAVPAPAVAAVALAICLADAVLLVPADSAGAAAQRVALTVLVLGSGYAVASARLLELVRRRELLAGLGQQLGLDGPPSERVVIPTPRAASSRSAGAVLPPGLLSRPRASR